MNRPNRSKYEMLSDILRAIGTNKTTICGLQLKTCISYQHLKKYLTYLVQIELIIFEKEGKKFRITQQGLYVLDIYTKLDELLVRNISHSVMKTSDYFSPFP
ncbi:MAG: winged helix-turn-helix domain-containing protein [Nitrososphaeraceae archaeon]